MNQKAPSKQQIVMELVKGVQHDIRLYNRLYKTLLKQQHCYIRLDNKALETVTAELTPLIESLHANATHRTKLLHFLGFDENKDGVKQFISALPRSIQQSFRTQWDTLEQQVNSCQKQNQLNGQISASLNEMLLDIDSDNNFHYSTAKLMEL